MKRVFLIAVLSLVPFLLFTDSQEVDDGIDALVGTIDLSGWDAWIEREGLDVGFLPSEFLREIAGMRFRDESKALSDKIGAILLPGLKSALVKMTVFLGFAVLTAAIGGLSETSQTSGTAKIAFRFIAAGTVMVLSASELRTASGTVSGIAKTAELLLPAILGFLMLGGMEHTAALLSVSGELLSGSVLKIIGSCVVPLAAVGGILLALDAGGTGRLASIGKVLHRAAKWILGTVCSLFLVFTAVRGVAAGSADGLLLKTTKLMAGSIPSIGGLLSESVDAAFQCLQLVKNALGLTGSVLILVVAAKPVLSVFWTRCALRVSSLLSEPLSGKPYAELLRGMGETLHLLLLSELGAAASALLMIAQVFGIGRFV
ncbi:MAG: hypothetical protein IJJ86_03140 [Clostridia bacterium]|nr:hypothetical protein [Clostridia bacterium]